MSRAELASQLAEIGRQFYGRGWVMGTSGNFSAVVSRDPLRLAITSSGVDKGSLSPGDIVEIDQHGGGRRRLGPPLGRGEPSPGDRPGPRRRRGVAYPLGLEHNSFGRASATGWWSSRDTRC